MNFKDIDKSLIVIVASVVVILVLIAVRPSGGFSYYTSAVDSWSFVHYLAGFVMAGALMIMKIQRHKILATVTVLGLLFEIWEHLYMTELAQAGGVEGFNNVFLDIVFVWLGAITIFIFRDYVNGKEVE